MKRFKPLNAAAAAALPPPPRRESLRQLRRRVKEILADALPLGTRAHFVEIGQQFSSIELLLLHLREHLAYLAHLLLERRRRRLRLPSALLRHARRALAHHRWRRRAYLDEARLIEFVGITSAYWSPAHEDLSDVGFTTIIAGKCGPRRTREGRAHCGCDPRGCAASFHGRSAADDLCRSAGNEMWHGGMRA